MWIKTGEGNGIEHLIERQILLRNALARAAQGDSAKRSTRRYSFITISRDAGAMGDTVVQELSRQTGWHIFDKEIVNHIAQNAHVRERLVQELDERSLNLIHDSVSRVLRMAEWGPFGVDEYHEALVRTLVYLAAQGEAILVGRGANFVLRGSGRGLDVRITGSPDVRVRRLAREWGVSREEARKKMLELDAERRHFIRRHFQAEIDDVSCYDLLFNTDHLSVQQVASCILNALTRPEASQAAASCNE